MRALILLATTALAAFGQQGIGNDRAMQGAVRRTLRKAMETPVWLLPPFRSPSVGWLRFLPQPSPVDTIYYLPDVQCAVPLVPVPTADVDTQTVIQLGAGGQPYWITSTIRPCGQ